MAPNRQHWLMMVFFVICWSAFFKSSILTCPATNNKLKVLLLLRADGGKADGDIEAFRRLGDGYRNDEVSLKILHDSSKDSVNTMRLLETELRRYKGDEDSVILVSRSADLIFNAKPEEITKRFYHSGARVIFSANELCERDSEFSSQYLSTEHDRHYSFMNSDVFIGFASDFYRWINAKDISTSANNFKSFYSEIYLNQVTAEGGLILDCQSQLFLKMNKATLTDLRMYFNGNRPYFLSAAHKTVPMIVIPDKPTKRFLNYTMYNYEPDEWNPDVGCVSCWRNVKSLNNETDFPLVMLGVFIEQATPFLEEFFTKLYELDYPKERQHLFIFNAAAYHKDSIDEFAAKNGVKYRSIKVITVSDNFKGSKARNQAIKECSSRHDCDYYFNVDAIAHLDNPHTLCLLIEQNRPVISPMMIVPYTTRSNFLGAVDLSDRNTHSVDYEDIVQNKRRGLWSVPSVITCYLLREDVVQLLAKLEAKDSSDDITVDSFSRTLREIGVSMFVTNRLDWGHLVAAENFSTIHLYNELYEIVNNRWDWEKRYLHENYTQSLDLSKPVAMPCTDVFWFPMVTERFADEIVAEMENYGKWAGVNISFAPRLINMEGIGFEEGWAHFLTRYVQPLQQRTFEGYWKPPKANLNFVIRYRPDEMPELKPHHDVSTYTINIALNRAGIDYEGGGCRFLRYNCTVSDTRKGWMLLHPGKFSHYHQGLPTTSGTRYILVSFIDP